MSLPKPMGLVKFQREWVGLVEIFVGGGRTNQSCKSGQDRSFQAQLWVYNVKHGGLTKNYTPNKKADKHKLFSGLYYPGGLNAYFSNLSIRHRCCISYIPQPGMSKSLLAGVFF